MEKIIIVAVDKASFGIGYKNNLLYRNKLDLARFKKLTLGHHVLMGNNTFKSIGKPLIGRKNIIVSRCPATSMYENLVYKTSIEEGERFAESDGCKKLFIIGGEEIYNNYIQNKLYDRLELTLHSHQKGKAADAFFPRIDWSKHLIVSETIVDDTITFVSANFYKNKQEADYLFLLQDIIKNGEKRNVRNGSILSLFGKSLEFDLSHAFPLLTTKQVWFKGVVEELLWFIRGQTDVNLLRDKKVHIWDGNTSRDYLDSIGLKEYKEYDGGPIYGFQWRHWNAKYSNCKDDYSGKGIDQLKECIKEIKSNPTSRRILFTAWNPEQLNEMALPPCHVLYQFYVTKAGYLNCQMYQRSADVFLGVPFNIASVALLTSIMAHYCDLKAGKIRLCFGDVHLYENHVEVAKQQLERIPKLFPKLEIIGEKPDKIENYNSNQFKILAYNHCGKLSADMLA